MYGSAVATLSLHVVDKQHARLLQHIADAWDLRQTIQIPHAVWPDAIVGGGQGVIDDTETAVHRALDEALRDRLDSCIGCGCLSLKACALYNPGDLLGRQAVPAGAALLPALLRMPKEN